MNIKSKSMIAASVATLMAASVAPSYAGVDGLYASLRVGIQAKDNGDGEDSTTSIESFASRLGYKGEADLGNGVTGFGKLEFGIDVEDNDKDDNGDEDSTSIRHGVVGLKGNFGKLYIGQTYHTFFNFTVAPIDNPWWYAGENMISYVGRTSDGLSYEHNIGGLGLGFTTYLDNDSEDEGTEFGLSYDFGPVKVAAGRRDLDSFSDPIDALTLSGKVGDLGLAATYQEQGEDDSIEASLTYKSFYVQLGEAGESNATTLGYTRNLGPKTLLWFELFSKDQGDGSDDDVAAIATLKYDIF